jgi:hypothetical protein
MRDFTVILTFGRYFNNNEWGKTELWVKPQLWTWIISQLREVSPLLRVILSDTVLIT